MDLEQRVRADHPLRAIREVVGTALAALSGDFAFTFAAAAYNLVRLPRLLAGASP